MASNRRFQRQYDLDPSGIVNEETRTKVREVRRSLVGVDPADPDSIRAFQQEHDLEADGVLGPRTRGGHGRRALGGDTAPAHSERSGPALILLDPEGDVQAITPAATRWMAELVDSSATGMRPVPEPVYIVAGRARATRAGVATGAARVRVRTTSGGVAASARRLRGRR